MGAVCSTSHTSPIPPSPIFSSIRYTPMLATMPADKPVVWACSFVLSAGKPFVRGRAAIERAYRGAGGPLSLRAVAFAAEGNTGYIIGAYTNLSGAPDRGKFTLTLRKDGAGRWLIMSDMDNDIRPL